MTNEQTAQAYAEKIISQLRDEDSSFEKAEMVDCRVDGGYCEPKIRLVNGYGTFEAWAEDGQGVNDMQWEEVAN